MKILFLNPPFKSEHGRYSRTSRSPAITKGGTLYYPFWLAYAAGVAEQAGFEVELIDAPAQRISTADLLQRIIINKPGLIVVDTSTPSISSDINICEQIKAELPNSFIVLVGTHPSALPEETIKASSAINAIARREYDFIIRDLAQALQSRQDWKLIRGLTFIKDDQVVNSPDMPLIEDIDSLPFASKVYKKFLNPKDYFFAAADYPMMMIITGRGCPFRCFFCVYPQTFHSRRYRLRSAESVVAEFEYIIKEFPEVREIGIEDDTFTAIKRRTQEICRLIIEKGIRIKWYANVRVDLDLETMKLMKKAGCHLVTVGYESGSQKVLDGMHKGTKVEDIVRFSANTKKAGLLVHGCFMAGNPGETKETLQESLDLSLKLNNDTMQYFPLMVYPGTEAFTWAKQNGYIKAACYDDWLTDNGLHNCVVDLPDLTSEILVDWCNKARKTYYLRREYIFYKLFHLIRHPGEWRRTMRSLITFARHLFSRSKMEQQEKC